MKKSSKTLKNSEKAITLIALVITIIVLLILAGISISMLSGDNSILQKATDAKTKTGESQIKEEIGLAWNGVQTEGIVNGWDINKKADELKKELQKTDTGTTKAKVEGSIIKVTYRGYDATINTTSGSITSFAEAEPDNPNATLKVSENKEKTFDANKELVDDYGNKITVPKGFKITSDSPSVVTAGIVIEDATYTNTIGSQFVWIPVGTGENAIKKNEEGAETVEIALDRYVFEDDTCTKTGVPTALSQNFSNETGYHYYVKNNYTETPTYREGSKDENINATAKELSTFISSANSKGGFYIGRYEARTATQRTSSTSNDLTITDSNLTQITEKQNDYVYNYVTQLQAAKLSREMYSKDNENNNITEFTSDLMNSYAWDTATLFLQECGEEGYSIKGCVYNSPAEKGTSTDHPCNIFDMASNCFEWTTETFSGASTPCVRRGAFYGQQRLH